MIDPAKIREEQADYERRRDAAQAQANAAQLALNNASREVIAYDAAAQVCAKLLASIQSEPQQQATPEP